MDYRDLIAWQKSMALAEQIYRKSSTFPREERYGLTSQMRRAAVSIPSNIAEGQGRRTTDEEFVRFFRIALGSLAELETQVELACRLKFIGETEANSPRAETGEVGRVVTGLMKSKQH